MSDESRNRIANKKQAVFIAYPYREYPQDEYRALFRSLGRLFHIDFLFADESVTSLQILRKIEGLICSSEFGIYDITGWNANVTLELGLALGLNRRVYLAIMSGADSPAEVPSDLRGIDRIQFASLAEFRSRLHNVLQEHFGLTGKLLRAPDVLWSPSGQPKPTPLVYAAAFRDIAVHLVPDLDRPQRAIVDLSLRVESGSWRSMTYDNAPWVHIDFLDSRHERVEIPGCNNWVTVEFRANTSRYLWEQKTLLSNRWSEVIAVRVWAGAGYALSTSWYKNLSPYMILARCRQLVTRSRRRLAARQN